MFTIFYNWILDILPFEISIAADLASLILLLFFETLLHSLIKKILILVFFRLRSAYVFVLLLLLVLSEGHFPIPREQRLFFPNPIRRLTNIVLTSFTLTTTETVNPTCFQLLNERIPVCQRKKRQIFWDGQSLGRNFGYRANFGGLHTLPYPFALQYSRFD